MRKLLFAMLATIFILVLSNCNGDSGSSGFDPNDTISKATAFAMYNHYMDSNVNKTDSAIIRQIFPPVESLKDALKTNHLVGFKLLIGAYLNNDSVVERRNQPMVMMQLKTQQGGTTKYLYYDLNSLTQEIAPDDEIPYCPPPPGCVNPIED